MDYSIFIKEFKPENWERFVAICSEFEDVISDLRLNQEFENKIPDDIQKVACYKLRNNAKLWFYEELPLLEGVKPIELFELKDGVTVVKEILLRLPT